jgi:predicted RND superfamily exporter protein
LLVQVHSAIARVPEVGGTYSALTFMPAIPASGGIRNTARRAVFRKLLQAEKTQLASEGVLAIDANGEHWRVTAKVPVLHSLNYGELTQRIQQACRPVESQLAATPGIWLTFTGLNPVFHEAQQLLFSDLANSFAMAFLLITPMMVWVLRSWMGGLLAMVPNVAPIALVFGAMGWMNIPLDIASILTASVALGIAVDDTLHFITWFRRGRGQGDTVLVATQFAFDKCALAMLQTTCICCAAMLAFVPTEFIPTRKFAILMSLMLAAAVLGDLILLPALLASRLGRWIFGRWIYGSPNPRDS